MKKIASIAISLMLLFSFSFTGVLAETTRVESDDGVLEVSFVKADTTSCPKVGITLECRLKKEDVSKQFIWTCDLSDYVDSSEDIITIRLVDVELYREDVDYAVHVEFDIKGEIVKWSLYLNLWQKFNEYGYKDSDAITISNSICGWMWKEGSIAATYEVDGDVSKYIVGATIYYEVPIKSAKYGTSGYLTIKRFNGWETTTTFHEGNLTHGNCVGYIRKALLPF